MAVIKITNKKRGGKGEYVGRPSVLGNPFPLRSEEERERVIRRFEEWLEQALKRDAKVRAEMNRLYSELIKKGSLELTCWCSPRPCHAEVIARKLAEAARARGLTVEVEYG